MKEELKIKDVMVGDWVDVRNDAAPNTPHLERITPSHFLRDEHWYGVELVSEILEKNGFTKELDADGLHYCFTLIDGHTKFSILYARSVFQWFSPLDFKYVHELQHALKLCGIEKEIEL